MQVDDADYGALARAAALEADVPEWQKVVGVERHESGTKFRYEDGRVWGIPAAPSEVESRGSDVG